MFENKIINDINGTYLVISSNEIVLSDYELKMFEYNDIKGFLPIMVSRVNNNVQFHYKIMNYDNLTKAFYNKTFDIDEIKSIFQAITAIGQYASEYLLNTDSILLNPEYIYMRNKEYLFCYLPMRNQSFHKGVRELMEYILERLDHENQKNVMLAYGLYQKVLKHNFTMEMLMDEFFKESEQQMEENVVTIDFGHVNGEKIKPTIKESDYKESRNYQLSDIEALEAELNYVENEQIAPKGTKQDAKEKFNLHHFFEKKKTIFFNNKSGKKEDILKKQNRKLILAEKSPYGSTQLLTGKSLVNQSGGSDILLINFPIEIGSGIIDNQAVSRRHALVTLECGNYYVEDQGSTNGTFINGSRISPYESVLIKEGDIVSFANEKFRLN